VLLEVDLQTVREGLPAHEENDLFNHARSLSVSNSIDQRLSHVSSSAVSLDLVVRGHEVFLESPSLVASHVNPRLRLEFFNRRSALSASVVRDTSGKSFVEPEVVPPSHGDKVSEPHVGQLMLHHHAEESQLRGVHVLLGAHDRVGVSNASNVLHSAIFVVSAHHVIDLGEGVASSKALLVECDSSLGDSEHQLVSHVFFQTLSHEDSLGDVHGVQVLEDMIGSRTNSKEVGRNARGFFKNVHGNLIILVEFQEVLDSVAFEDSHSFFGFSWRASVDAVTDSNPIFRDGYTEGHFSFQVRLVEYWENSEAVESFALGVQVLEVILQISEGVHASGILVVSIYVLKLHRVPAKSQLSHLQWDLLILERRFVSFLGLTVDLEARDSHRLEVNEELAGCRLLIEVEIDRGVSEVIFALRQRQLEIVLDI